ncbi:hypothetical protein F2Q69_00046461 [Brassica cretica]|uniref:Uncharacterized protein n=1 Tax=Brassica cretica TaxID=69181 RepID=A0A8S9PKC2_BRACR|nr:hypothetical protein F2Q69_00046461 [Brassica cretica]
MAAARPWSLRTRRALCSEPGDESPAKTEIGKDIKEDFSNMIGKRLPRRPKKKPNIVQKKLNVSFV